MREEKGRSKRVKWAARAPWKKFVSEYLEKQANLEFVLTDYVL